MIEYLPYLALFARILLLGYEKIVLKKLSHDHPTEATLLYFAIATLLLIPLLFFCPSPDDYTFLLYVAFFSGLYATAFMLFVHSLSIGEASLVSPLYDFNVLFVALLSAIFLHEPLTPGKVIGIVFLMYGSSFLSQQNNPFHSLKQLLKQPACLYMILCSFIVAVGRMLDGTMIKVNKMHPILYSFYLYLGITIWLIIGVILLHSTKRSTHSHSLSRESNLASQNPHLPSHEPLAQFSTNIFVHTYRLFREKTMDAIITGAINAYAYCFFVYAITKIDLSIAQPICMLAVIVTMLFAKFIFHENIGRRMIGASIMIMGAFCLSFF